ncbi:MAG: hypothetical protein KAS53_12560 [Candidatus Cloacimonetes bacterium]|nr:hypothetical protein [Candidatus Cloacimonadota bacterium]
MKTKIILLSLWIIYNLFINLNAQQFTPYHQSYVDSIWFPNTELCDNIPILETKTDRYVALKGGLAHFSNNTTYMIPYPYYSKYGDPLRSMIRVENELLMSFQNHEIIVYDINTNLYTRSIEIEDELNYNKPYSNIKIRYGLDKNTILISTKNGVYSFNPKNDSIKNISNERKDLINKNLPRIDKIDEIMDDPIKYFYVLQKYENELLIMTNYGLCRFNFNDFKMIYVENSNDIGFINSEVSLDFVKTDSVIFFMYVTYGHDTQHQIYEYNLKNKLFSEVTPSIKSNFKKKYYWKYKNDLYFLDRNNLETYIFYLGNWLKTDKRMKDVQGKEYFQNCLSEIQLKDGRVVKINETGLTVVEN